MTNRNAAKIARIQESLLAMPIGSTGTRFGVVVTRWAKDAFEVETWGALGWNRIGIGGGRNLPKNLTPPPAAPRPAPAKAGAFGVPALAGGKRRP